jgi:hypothetical protein
MRYNQTFSKILMIPDFVRGHFIQWELDPFFNGEKPYNFILQISQTIDFSEIAKEFKVGDSFFAIDDSGYKQSWSMNYNYRVLLLTADGNKYYSPPILFGDGKSAQRKYSMAGEIIRKELLLCRYAGHQAWLLKRKSYGFVSPKTSVYLDPISGVPIADERDVDYGVGLDGGYFSPVACVYTIDRSTADKQLDPAGIGVKETIDLIVRMPGYPAIDTRDIICANLDGWRYNVIAKDISYFPGTGIPISQKVSLRTIPQTDTIYNIELPVNFNE